ncbi:MAG: Lrp/AsnC family transcriptional regulator [Halopseudomonas sp.]
MDKIDKRILQLLQQDTTLSTAAIAEQVGLSPTPCWRRVQNMEKSGVIRSRVALLDREKLNLGVDVFVTITTNQHNTEWLERFAEQIQTLDEVVECYRMSGDVDYMLRVVVSDISAYDRFYKRLIEHTEITNVSSRFAMERMKYTTALPLDLD